MGVAYATIKVRNIITGSEALELRVKVDSGATMLVLPADHAIANGKRFLKLLNEAAEVASAGTHLVTLGITPDRPATGYGYIQASSPAGVAPGVFVVERFTEKKMRESEYFSAYVSALDFYQYFDI